MRKDKLLSFTTTVMFRTFGAISIQEKKTKIITCTFCIFKLINKVTHYTYNNNLADDIN